MISLLTGLLLIAASLTHSTTAMPLPHYSTDSSSSPSSATSIESATSAFNRLASTGMLHGMPSSSLTGGYLAITTCLFFLIMGFVLRWTLLRLESRRERRAAVRTVSGKVADGYKTVSSSQRPRC